MISRAGAGFPNAATIRSTSGFTFAPSLCNGTITEISGFTLSVVSLAQTILRDNQAPAIAQAILTYTPQKPAAAAFAFRRWLERLEFGRCDLSGRLRACGVSGIAGGGIGVPLGWCQRWVTCTRVI